MVIFSPAGFNFSFFKETVKRKAIRPVVDGFSLDELFVFQVLNPVQKTG
jgi:hypothetical protein